MPYQKNVKKNNSTTAMAKNLSSGLPAGTRVSISLLALQTLSGTN